MAAYFTIIKPVGKKEFLERISEKVFGHQGGGNMKVGIYARVSTHDQHTLPMQIEAMKKYAKARSWKITLQVEDIGSGVKERIQRERLLIAARKREIDAVLVWKLDRWGRSLPDLVMTLQELTVLDVGFISLTEALDMTTPTGRAMVGLLAVFAQFERDLLRERVKAGIAHAREKGKPHGRPKTAFQKADKVIELYKKGQNKSQIARKLKIGRTSVRRIITSRISEMK